MPTPRKRFYKVATVATAADGFAILLDGRAVKTPALRPLTLPNAALAEAVAGEWQAQGEEIRPHTMPLTQLASTALDRIGTERELVAEQLVRYGGTDLLCYRAEAPVALVRRQDAGWQPLLDWAEARFAARLTTTAGVMAVEQPEVALAALGRAIAGIDDWRMAALSVAAAASGSLVLALALVEGRLSAAEVFSLSQLDESFQIEQWGEDAEAVARRAALEADILAAGFLLDLL
ncbi:MAG: ATPase [Magnetospirillum sp.]|nr:ATPase [Magnetospirillum sp.]